MDALADAGVTPTPMPARRLSRRGVLPLPRWQSLRVQGFDGTPRGSQEEGTVSRNHGFTSLGVVHPCTYQPSTEAIAPRPRQYPQASSRRWGSFILADQPGPCPHCASPTDGLHLRCANEPSPNVEGIEARLEACAGCRADQACHQLQPVQCSAALHDLLRPECGQAGDMGRGHARPTHGC